MTWPNPPEPEDANSHHLPCLSYQIKDQGGETLSDESSTSHLSREEGYPPSFLSRLHPPKYVALRQVLSHRMRRKMMKWRRINRVNRMMVQDRPDFRSPLAPWPPWWFHPGPKLIGMITLPRHKYQWTMHRYLVNMFQDPGGPMCRTFLMQWIPRWSQRHLNHLEPLVRARSLHRRLTREQNEELSLLYQEEQEKQNPPVATPGAPYVQPPNLYIPYPRLMELDLLR